ncbi:hypothetical protein PoB_007465900 [Plakobranchus ocellatus]|uniref:Uncharacterized protein n=1 Tax=Plakobranchus ocellatus TaxID=259542 RepID=A0AAV4DVJ3_9GAST|nr:hypothetical protein PoB_007465900 [Plakobranchus ocellatus]
MVQGKEDGRSEHSKPIYLMEKHTDFSLEDVNASLQVAGNCQRIGWIEFHGFTHSDTEKDEDVRRWRDSTDRRDR